jgi:hypothetical protein
MPKNDIIVLAQHLMQHGIIGKAKVRQLQRHETARPRQNLKPSTTSAQPKSFRHEPR